MMEKEELQELYNGFDFGDFKSIDEVVNITKEFIKDSQAGNRKVYPTGWPRLDKQLLGGLQPGKLYIVGGRPGSSKSQFSNQMLFNVLDIANKDKENLVVFYWSFEMKSEHQLMRIVSGDLNKSTFDLLKPQDFNSEHEKILDNFKKYPIFFFDVPETLIYFKGKINQFCKSNPNITLINLIDHTRLFKGGNREEKERISDLTKALMEQQSKYGTISILLSQLNRNIESNERANNQYQPMLSDLFASDSGAQDAHVVMMLNRPYDIYGIEETYCGENPKGLLAVHLEKNRDGQLGMVPFQTHFPSFKLTERT